jgi:hypothetical protein
MPGLVPGIHVFKACGEKAVDGGDMASGSDTVLQRASPGHDGEIGKFDAPANKDHP